MSAATAAEWTGADLAVSDLTRRWVDESVPANTRRAYAWAWKRFAQWCSDHDRTALPSSAATLTEHVACLRSGGSRPATIDQAIGVILAIHGREKARKPDTEDARRILRGYRKELAEDGWSQRQATPFTRDTLHQTVT
ncbi:MAG: hypothetical protein ACRDNS_00135, partial [Trebonia sp.]